MPPLTPNEQKLMALIIEAAEQNEPCPKNALIADILEMESIATPSYLIRSLEKKGVISVERYAQARRVTINRTGQRTANPAWPQNPDRPKQSREKTRSQFAEKLSEGLSLKAASEALSISHPYGRVLLAEIKRDLGWQAC